MGMAMDVESRPVSIVDLCDSDDTLSTGVDGRGPPIRQPREADHGGECEDESMVEAEESLSTGGAVNASLNGARKPHTASGKNMKDGSVDSGGVVDCETMPDGSNSMGHEVDGNGIEAKRNECEQGDVEVSRGSMKHEASKSRNGDGLNTAKSRDRRSKTVPGVNPILDPSLTKNYELCIMRQQSAKFEALKHVVLGEYFCVDSVSLGSAGSAFDWHDARTGIKLAQYDPIDKILHDQVVGSALVYRLKAWNPNVN